MGNYLKKLFKTPVLFCLLILLIGCSQASPEISEVNYSVVFEYLNNKNLPEARLCVFTENSSDVRRCERMIIKSLEEGYIWDFDDLAFAEDNKLQWCGSTNLVVPENRMIPSGKYQVTIIHADEKEDCVIMSVDYDKEFYNLTSEDVEEEMKNLGGINYIAVYDKENTIVYYGERTADLSTNRDIWNMYREAVSYNDIWFTPGQFLICIMPKQNLISDKENIPDVKYKDIKNSVMEE